MQYNPPFGSTDPNAAYVNGNPAAGIQGSIPPAELMEFTQREIVNTITAAGLTPNNLDLRQLMQAIRGGALSYFPDFGIANTLIVNPNPAYINYFTGMTMTIKPAYGCTGPTTININGLGPQPVVKKGGTALSGGEWQSGDIIEIKYTGTAFQILAGGSTSGGVNYQFWCRQVAGSYSFTVGPGISAILVSVWGGGGGGSGAAPGSYAQGNGGGGGGFTMDILAVVPGQQITAIVGAGAPRSTAGLYNGATGGTSSFGATLIATGGAGALPANTSTGPAAGGIGSGGTVNLPGGLGRGGFFVNNGATPIGGFGGPSWCSGDVAFSQGAQHDGAQPGQGGSGASTTSGNVAGGAGKDGMIIVQNVG